MGPVEQQLTSIVAPAVTALGYELVGIEYISGGGNPTVRIYIDREEGITIDDCERVSRQVSAVLDVNDPIHGHYLLEVSSPGLDRPLFTAEHYARFAGSDVKIKLVRPIAGRRNFKGTLKGIKDDEVIVEIDGVEQTLPLGEIERARVVPKW